MNTVPPAPSSMQELSPEADLLLTLLHAEKDWRDSSSLDLDVVYTPELQAGPLAPIFQELADAGCISIYTSIMVL